MMDALHRKPLLYLVLLGLRWQSFWKSSLVLSSTPLASCASADQTSHWPREKEEEKVQSSSTLSTTPPPPPPNIIILFADNLAYEDISFFQRQQSTTATATKQQQSSPPPKTPHVDSLGNAGMSFSHWNSAAHLCSASRAALLTGQYPVRTGIYPGVFHPDSIHGLASNDTRITTLASQLKKRAGYATSIVGKWHLGHARTEYLPTSHGFDEWLGIPYHMSGGSVDNHTCVFDEEQQEMWLPLYQNGSTIVEQPVRLEQLAKRYAHAATDFIHRSVTGTGDDDNHDGRSSTVGRPKPFFLYMAFSHVHQLCAPAHWSEQDTCQWSAATPPTSSSFADAVQEMDWIVGQILKTLADEDIVNNTMVWFTSDNGPWVAEQDCSGSKGPFQGQWLREHVPLNCTACPSNYIPQPTLCRPRRCVLSKPRTKQQGQTSLPLLQQDEEEESWTLDGVHCGDDVGLGSLWEANLRMPAMVQWPGRIPAKSTSNALVSTLDIMPTILAIVHKYNRIQQTFPQNTGSASNQEQKLTLDGMDLSPILLFDSTSRDNDNVRVERTKDVNTQDFDNRVLFFWRDGFEQGPLDPPYGRMDVAAVKVGPRLKAWLWTKSAHYNNDTEVHHDPPLIFDVINDPAEAHPLDPEQHIEFIAKVKRLVRQHKEDMEPWGRPLTLERNAEAIPCVDRAAHCRTHDPPETTIPDKASFLESFLAGSDQETASDTR